nr:MAG TPA: hypothetical protein [Crassvirales sp.]
MSTYKSLLNEIQANVNSLAKRLDNIKLNSQAEEDIGNYLRTAIFNIDAIDFIIEDSSK